MRYRRYHETPRCRKDHGTSHVEFLLRMAWIDLRPVILKGKLHLPTINIQEISWVKVGLVKVDKLISYTKSFWCGSSDCSQQLVGRVYRSTLQRCRRFQVTAVQYRIQKDMVKAGTTMAGSGDRLSQGKSYYLNDFF